MLRYINKVLKQIKIVALYNMHNLFYKHSFLTLIVLRTIQRTIIM